MSLEKSSGVFESAEPLGIVPLLRIIACICSAFDSDAVALSADTNETHKNAVGKKWSFFILQVRVNKYIKD
ncbi:hypothetical protein GCM10026988_17390 [Vibrio panuliri]